MRPHINSFAALLKKSFIPGVFECSNSHRTKNFHNTVQKHKSIVWMFCKHYLLFWTKESCDKMIEPFQKHTSIPSKVSVIIMIVNWLDLYDIRKSWQYTASKNNISGHESIRVC